MTKAGHIVVCSTLVALLILGASHADVRASDTPSSAPSTAAVVVPADVTALVSRLGDPDPDARQAAGDELVQRGLAARPAVIAAAQSGDPEVSAQAASVLLRLPWEIDSDTAGVKSLLSNYGRRAELGRVELASKVLEHHPESLPTMWRLLLQDPSPTTRWGILELLRYSGGPEFVRWFRQNDPVLNDDANSTALTLAGLAWMGRDGDKSLRYFRRAIDLESDRPTDDDDQLAPAFELVCDDAVDHDDFEKAAAYRRMQCERRGFSERMKIDPVFRLFALHADHGPLNDFDADLQTFAAEMGRPAVLMSLARLRNRQGDRLAADALMLVAEAVASEPMARLRLSEQLQLAGWIDLAERELLAVADRPKPPDRWHVQAQLMLFYLAKQRDDFTDAADYLRQALDGRAQVGLAWTRGGGDIGLIYGQLGVGATSDQIEAELLQELDVLDFRAARARKDSPAIEKQLSKIVASTPTDADVLSEIFPELRVRGRAEEVARLFDPTYAAAKAKLEAEPKNPQAMNELAWLCARCDMHLDEAVKFSTQAVELEPRSSAYLDTAAEADYRAGNYVEAVRLETEALRVTPREVFMRKQLARFKQAASLGTRPAE